MNKWFVLSFTECFISFPNSPHSIG